MLTLINEILHRTFFNKITIPYAYAHELLKDKTNQEKEELIQNWTNFLKMIITLLVIGLLFIMYTYTRDCIAYQEIVKIGGCDSKGQCGVLLTNGQYALASKPVEGYSVCVKRESLW